MDGNVSAGQRQGGLFRGKIPFRADEDGNVPGTGSIQNLPDALPGMGFVLETVGDEPQRFFAALRMTYEFFHGEGLRYFRNTGLEGLFGGGKGYAKGALRLVHLALRMLSYQRHNAVHAQLRGLFHEPLKAVVVLGGAAAYGKVVGMGSPIGLL